MACLPGLRSALRPSLAGLRADHSEAEDAVIAPDKELEEPLQLADRLRPDHGARRYLCNPYGHAFALRLALAQSHAGKRRVGEHAIGNDPLARAALFCTT